MSELTSKKCVPCEGGVPALTAAEAAPLLAQIHGWQIVDGHHLRKVYAFPDFMSALGFVNRAGAVAEEEGHHPNLMVTWGRVEAEVWTHAVDGLTENDFILAAKMDAAV